ncbi:phytoene desaturase family protein [Jatrophihabitans sp. YIM 134969]
MFRPGRTPARVTGRTDRVVVIGAGLGGLAAALHLAGAGRQVTVLEREAVPGGRAGRLELGGYRFDTGPTVLTMPELVDEALGAVGQKLEGRVRLHRLDPAYQGRFADGSRLHVHTDVDRMADEIGAQCSSADAAGYRELVSYLTKMFDVEMPHFIARNLDSPASLVGPSLLQLVRMGGMRKLSSVIGDFVQDERLRRMFSFQAMYAGLAPADALAIYAVITYFDCVSGVYFPEGGMHAIPRVMAEVAQEAGVDIRYSTPARRIEVAGDRATAVVTADGERIPADVVVLNADPPQAYPALLPAEYVPRRFRPTGPTRLRYSPSCVVMHTGSSKVYDDLGHHTIFFGRQWERTFSEIIDDGVPMSDPSFLVTSPSHTDPALAPDGHATYYTLFPSPNLDHRDPIDWRTAGPRYREHMHATMRARGLEGFEEATVVEELVTPSDWEAMGLAAGAPFAAAHTFAQTGPFRPGTVDPRIGNLLRCGSGVQPGVGVPMVLVSGKLAAERVTG